MPTLALVEGAKQVAERIYEQHEFANFMTAFFNDKYVTMPTEDYQDFCNKIDKVDARSKTDFVETFNRIVTYCSKVNPNDLTVLFLTDGNDTCNKPEEVTNSLNFVKDYLKKSEITSRFFTIGLSSEHDAILLSKIIQAGSDLGNFFYVDYSEENETRTYKDTLKECLVKTFDLGVPNNALCAEIFFEGNSKRVYLSPQEKSLDEDQIEVTERHVLIGNLIFDSLPISQLELRMVGIDHTLFVEPEVATDMDLSKSLKVEINIINQVMFDFIQELVDGKKADVAK